MFSTYNNFFQATLTRLSSTQTYLPKQILNVHWKNLQTSTMLGPVGAKSTFTDEIIVRLFYTTTIFKLFLTSF